MKVSKTHAGTAAGTASVVAAALLGLGAVASTTKSSLVQTIYVQNKSTFVSDSVVRNDLPAFQAAVSKDFAPIWHVDAKLVWLDKSKPVPAGAESIVLLDKSDQAGALAYHELTNGVPDSKVFVGTSRYYGYSWQVGATHELFEMLADPGLIHTAQSADSRIWAQEVCDAVEADKFAYTRPGADGKPVLISDFITEKWFAALTVGPYDFANRVQTPYTILPGGYSQIWGGTTWVTVTNFREGGLGANGAFYDHQARPSRP